MLLPVLLPNTERPLDSNQLRVFRPGSQVSRVSQVVAHLKISFFWWSGSLHQCHLERDGGDDEVDVPALLSRLHFTLETPQPRVERVPEGFFKFESQLRPHLVPEARTLEPCSLASFTMFCTPSTVLGKNVLTVTLFKMVVPQLSKVSSM